jgi:hypothetical protein
MNGIKGVRLVVEPFLATEDEENDHHHRAREMVVEVAFDDLELR